LPAFDRFLSGKQDGQSFIQPESACPKFQFTLFAESAFWPFGAVLGTALATVFNTRGVEGAANDVILHTWKVLYTTTANENDRVLLEVVTFAWDISDDLNSVCETNLSHLAES